MIRDGHDSVLGVTVRYGSTMRHASQRGRLGDEAALELGHAERGLRASGALGYLHGLAGCAHLLRLAFSQNGANHVGARFHV